MRDYKPSPQNLLAQIVDAVAAEILRQAASIFLEQLRQNQVFLLFLAVWRDRPKQMFS